MFWALKVLQDMFPRRILPVSEFGMQFWVDPARSGYDWWIQVASKAYSARFGFNLQSQITSKADLVTEYHIHVDSAILRQKGDVK